MDRKTIVILVACVAMFALWPKLVDQMFPPTPVPLSTNAPVAGSNSPVSTNLSASPGVVAPALKPAATVIATVKPSTPEELLVVTNFSARYTFSSHWGGLKQIELTRYLDSEDGRKAGEQKPSALNAGAPFPVLALVSDDELLRGADYQLSQPSNGVVRAEATLAGGLVVTKEFHLALGYQFKARVRIENRGPQAVTVPQAEVILGTATPMSLSDDGRLVGLFAYDGVKAESISEGYFANRTLGCFPGTPRTEFTTTATNIVWASVHNQYFTLLAQPAGGAPRVIARQVSLPEPPAELAAADSTVNRKPVGYQAAFIFPASTLAPGGTVDREFEFYAGPKEYHTLSKLSDGKEQVMEFGGFFGWFAKALLLSMNGLHKLGISYGWAIVVITVIIKLVFWPLTAASTRSMKRMAKLQPQMAAIKEKYKDDSAKANQKTMEFMKENKVNPMGGCLPMLIQIPVFFGFYTMLQSAIELRGAPFLWISDLSRPDTLFIIPGINFPFNLMPLLMGATMIVQARLTPPSPGMDPMQQKIMKYMPLMFLFMLYNFSAGMTLYWTVQNVLTIAQMKLTKSDEAKAPAVVVAAPKKKK